MKPKQMLSDNTFWEIINSINWSSEDDEERMRPVLERLSKLEENEIKQFQENLSHKLYLLDTKEHARNIGEFSYKDDETHFSNDFFLYVRCCVVANGKKFYDLVLKDPRQMPKDVDFEPLLYIAEEAYEQKMNEELNYATGCSYETYSNTDGWK